MTETHRALGDVLDVAAGKIEADLQAGVCSIWLADESGALVIRAATSFEKPLLDTFASYRPGEGFTGWVFQHGRSLRIKDVAQMDADAERLLQTYPGLNWSRKYPVTLSAEERPVSYLAAPIIRAEAVFGVLRVSRNGATEFSDAELRKLEDHAGRLARDIDGLRRQEWRFPPSVPT